MLSDVQTYICTYLRKLVQMAECLDHRECSVSDPRIRIVAMVVKLVTRAGGDSDSGDNGYQDGGYGKNGGKDDDGGDGLNSEGDNDGEDDFSRLQVRKLRPPNHILKPA